MVRLMWVPQPDSTLSLSALELALVSQLGAFDSLCQHGGPWLKSTFPSTGCRLCGLGPGEEEGQNLMSELLVTALILTDSPQRQKHPREESQWALSIFLPKGLMVLIF
jgi:hypothetical protein